MNRFLFLIPFFVFCSIVQGQYFKIECDSQEPFSQYVLDGAYSGNTPFLKTVHYENGTPIDLTGWSMSFLYSYGQYSTQGMVEITGTLNPANPTNNEVLFLGATNLWIGAYDSYYFSVRGISAANYVKTFATGIMRIRFDPATETNIPTLMSDLNMAWLSNSVSAQVESNRVRIAVFETNKVNLSIFNGTNAIFEGRITTNTTDISELQGLTNVYNDVTNKASDTAVVALSNQLLLADGTLQTNINLSSNAWHTTYTAYVAQVEGATNDIILQLTTVETNQNATNTLLQTAIDIINTGTNVYSTFLLQDGTREANYLNIANTNYLGDNIITNGDFTSSADNWSLSGFFYSPDKVVLNPSLLGNIEYTNTLIITTNRLYQLTVKTIYDGAAITANVGGVSYAWTSINSNIYGAYFYAISDAKLIIYASTGTNVLELDDITLRECPTGSLFVAQDVNAGNSIMARVGVYAPNITAISNEYYPRSNPSNYISTGEGEPRWDVASNSVVYTNTIIYTNAVAKANAAYPASNPSNYVTASVTNGINTRLNSYTNDIAHGTTAYGWGNHADAGYLSVDLNLFADLTIGHRSELSTNICDLTQGVYTGSLSSVTYTGYCGVARGKTYEWGFNKDNIYGTGTLSIGTFSLVATNAGAISNYFTPLGVETQILLRIDGVGFAKSDVTNIYVKQITNGNLYVANNGYVANDLFVNETNVMSAIHDEVTRAGLAEGVLQTNVDLIQSAQTSISNIVDLHTSQIGSISNSFDDHKTNVNVHAIAAVSGLQDALDGKATTGDMVQAQGDIGDLQTATGSLNVAVGDLQTNTGTLNTAVGDLQTATNALDGRLYTVETGKVDLVDATYTATVAKADSALQEGASGTWTNLSDYNNDVPFATGTPVYVETDPSYSASVAAGILAADTNRWNTGATDASSWTNNKLAWNDGGDLTNVSAVVDYGTTDSTAARGDWGAAVSNIAVAALPASSTNALAVTALQVTGGSPTNGAVLVGTNTIGETKWSGPVMFKATLSGNFVFTNNVDRTISWETEIYDYGNNFSNPNFVAPVNGIYQFFLEGIWVRTDGIATRCFPIIKVNDAIVSFVDSERGTTVGPFSVNSGYISLTNGAVVYCTIRGDATGQTNFLESARKPFFSGALIRELP